MSGINFISENYYDNASATITTGAENAQFPLTNLDNDSPSGKFRSAGNTFVLELDLGQTRDIDSLVLVGDPTDAFGMTGVTYKTSVTTDFSGSPVNSVTLYPEQNIGISYITEVSHRFVELTFTGQGSFVEIGKIFIGKRINLPQNNFSIASFRYRENDLSVVKRSFYGQKYIDQRNFQRKVSGTIEYCTPTEQETLDDMYLYHGRRKPLVLIVDKDGEAITTGEAKLTVYGYLLKMPTWRANGGQLYTSSVEVEEAI